MKKITLLFAILLASLSYGQVVINEIDADQTSTDVMEFVELFSATPNQSLDGLVLVLFNGSDDASYNAVDLSGFTTDANGYFIVGGDEITGAEIMIGASNTIQNGADAVAIYTGNIADFPNDTPVTTTNLIDAVVYGTSDGDDTGLLGGLGETVQYDENANGLKDTESLQLNDGVFCASAPTLRAENVCEEAMVTEVSNIAELRAGTEGTIYNLTSEAILTFQQDFRNQKYIEDATGAILIDDTSGTLATAYTIGDGITGITGTLGSFQGTLQFVPTEDAGAASSTGNAIVAQEVTANMLNANPVDYESEYVLLTDTTIDNTNSTTWDNGQSYNLTTATGSYVFRAAFFDVDYIGTTVPATANISGIITRNDGMSFITARDASDIEATSAGCPLVVGEITVTCDSETTSQDGTTVMIPFSGGGNATYTIVSDVGAVSGDDPSTVAEGTIVITSVSESSNFVVFIDSALCDLEFEIDTPVCEPTPEFETIAELRAGTEGTEYILTGEAILTFQQTFRGQKFIEDNTAAILIDDNDGIITTTYAIGDGITGITGTLSSFGGMLQFVPSIDPGAATSTGNTIEAQEVTVTELSANPNDYESEFVKLIEVAIDNSTNTNWVNGTEYGVTTPEGAYVFRTSFFDVDYIGEVVPVTDQNISGIITERNDGDYFITARSLEDFEEFLSIGDIHGDVVSVFPNPASTTIVINTGNAGDKNVTIYSITGQEVMNITTVSSVDVSTLNSGIYLVKVVEADRTMTTKLIIK